MGQGQSKTPSGQEAKKNENQTRLEDNNDGGSVSAPTSTAAPTLGSKLFQMFSKPADDVSAVSQLPSALYKSPYAPGSPLPPSSSTLAQSFRKELTGNSPAQPKPNPSFFLGKVLVSPRRPLREYKSSSTHEAVSSPLVTSNAKASVGETPNFNLPTPKSLKRKALSPEYGNRNKSIRLERTASPALKDNVPFEPRVPQVEEQEEEMEEELPVPPIEAENETSIVIDHEVASHEKGDCVSEVNGVDEVDISEAATAGDAVTEQNNEYTKSEPNNCSNLRVIDESSMTAPYSPTQQPRSLMSAMDMSLSSIVSCASPATVLFRRDSTHDDLDISDAEFNDSNVTTKSHDGTVLQKLIDLKEYFLPGSDATSSQSNNLTVDSTQDSSHADTTLPADARSLPAAPDDNAVDMNSVLRLESVEASPNEPSDGMEECDPVEPHKSLCDQDSSMEGVAASIDGTCNAGVNGNSSVREGSVTSTSSGRSSVDDIDVNLLPPSRTTDCSTISKKQWVSEYKMTESKDKQKDKSGTEQEDNEASKISEAVQMRPRCSEDAYYHYPPVLSTFTSSISRMKWPSSLSISTSSASALGISTVDMFKSLPFFGDALKDDSGDSSDAADSNVEANSMDSEKTIPSKEVLPHTSSSGTSADTEPSTNGLVELEIADTDMEEQVDRNHDDANMISTMEKKNNQSPATNGSLKTASSISISDQSGSKLSTEQEQSWTPKRSRRLASRCTPTPNSNIKSLGSRMESAQDSPATPNRRWRRRSPSTDSNISKRSSSQSSLNLSPASSSRRQKKRRSEGSTDGSVQELANESSKISQNESQQPSTGDDDDDATSNTSLETNKSSQHKTVQDDSTELSKKSREPESKKAKTEATLQSTVAVLRENHTADYISNSQVLILVRSSNGGNSGALLRRLRQRFPKGSIVAKPQHSQKKRGGGNVTARQVERNIMQGRSPIIVEVVRGVSVVPFLFLAHSANYNTLFYQEDRYLDVSSKKMVQPSLPFCYSWFLNLTDSLELSRSAKQFFSRLLAVPVCQRDLMARTQHKGSVAELLSSYMPNNIVGGPKILHCTAKGGASSDPAYSAKPEVIEALGSTSSLLIVGFVLTPRTIGARVKLTSEQMLVWGNSDEPSVPKEIDQLFTEQENISVESGAVVGTSNGEDGDADSPNENGLEDSSEIVSSPTLNKKTKTSLKIVDFDGEVDLFCPTSGPGSRAHITLGCFSRDVHPRTTGFDLLKVIEKEQQAGNSGLENKTTVEESDHESDMENEGESSKPTASPTGTEINKVVSIPLSSSSSTEEDCSDKESVAVDDGSTNEDSQVVYPSASLRIEGASVRCYGDGVWVVYPDQAFEVTSIFSGFHNTD